MTQTQFTQQLFLSHTKSTNLVISLHYIFPTPFNLSPFQTPSPFQSLPLSFPSFSPKPKMAVELMGFQKVDEQKAIQEAASEGLKGMEHLIRSLSHQPNHLNTQLTDNTVSKFKKLISLLNRTGHARFRRAPVHSTPAHSLTTPVHSSPVHTAPSSSSHLPPPPPQQQTSTVSPPANFPSPAPVPVSIRHQPSQSLTLDFTKPNDVVLSSNGNNNKSLLELEFSKETNTFSVSSNSSFMSSAVTGDGSVSNGKQCSSIFLTQTATPAISGGKPPLSSGPSKKRCHDHGEHSDEVSGNGKCHCVKRRYTTYTTPRCTQSLPSFLCYAVFCLTRLLY